MSLWACPSCHTLQAFNQAMTCLRCGTRLNFVDLNLLTPFGEPEADDAVDPHAPDPGTPPTRENP
jgi:hypothetical protein